MLKKLCLTVFGKEKYMLHYEKLQLNPRLGLGLKKNTLCIRT